MFQVVSIEKDFHAAVHILRKGLDEAFCHVNLQAMLSCVFVAREFKSALWYCESHSTYSLEHLVKHILNCPSCYDWKSSRRSNEISYNNHKAKTTSKRYCSVVPPWFNAFCNGLFLMDDDEEEDL
nr:hypothetical protein CFP56_03429 [Quercus suber]